MKKMNYEAILSSFHDGVIALDSNGDIAWVNPAAEELAGVSGAALLGRRGASLFKNNLDLYEKVARAVSERFSMVERDVPFFSHSRGGLDVEVAVYPVEEESRCVVIVVRDLAPAKALEKFSAAGARHKEMETLSAGIAHEIKNPLSGIRGAAQLLHDELSSENKKLSGLISREVDRIDRLLVDFINMNQPETFQKEPMNIYPALDNVIQLMEQEARGKKIRIVKEYDPSIPPAMANNDRIKQVLLNLLKNAVEACGNRGVVTIKTSLSWKAPRAAGQGVSGRYLLVGIKDSGQGIKEETALKLFTPFFSSKAKGSGLGLAISRRLVFAHNGLLEVKNREDGMQGAEASLYLPYLKKG